jgi:DNA replication protein DnaC
VLKPTQRYQLMEIMDDRNESKSTVIISQLPTDQWYQSIGDAILDRLTHNAHCINLKGKSMRKTPSELT